MNFFVWSHTRIVLRKNYTTQIEVQTQIALWSDPMKRTPVCLRTKITGSGRKFERTTVGTVVCVGLMRGQFDLKNLIVGVFECIWACNGSSAIGSDQERIRAHLSLIASYSIGCYWVLSERYAIVRNWVLSERFWNEIASDQGPIRVHFSFFFYWEMMALPSGNNKSAFWSGTHLNSDGSD